MKQKHHDEAKKSKSETNINSDNTNKVLINCDFYNVYCILTHKICITCICAKNMLSLHANVTSYK